MHHQAYLDKSTRGEMGKKLSRQLLCTLRSCLHL